MPLRFELEPRTCITWKANGSEMQGVVLGQSYGFAALVPVLRHREGIKCYDEGGSMESRDADRVRLRHCPPPFSNLCLRHEKKCFGLAGKNDIIVLSQDELEEVNAKQDLSCRPLPQEDYSELLSRVWRDECEKKKPVRLQLRDLIREKRPDADIPDFPPKMAEMIAMNDIKSGNIVPRSNYGYGKPDPQKGPDGPSIC